MIDRYDLLDTISQGKNGEMPSENKGMEKVANDIRRAVGCCSTDEGQPCQGNCNAALNELEKRCAERWAKENNCWITFDNVFNLGIPGPSGSESDTYITKEGYVYKVNNLLHSSDSIVLMLVKTILYNNLFPDTAYTFVGFTGFDGRSVYPVIKQDYISSGQPATPNEIDCYMAACGFAKICDGRYSNDKYELWDVYPKNVLKDESGDIFIIDLEIKIVDD